MDNKFLRYTISLFLSLLLILNIISPVITYALADEESEKEVVSENNETKKEEVLDGNKNQDKDIEEPKQEKEENTEGSNEVKENENIIEENNENNIEENTTVNEVENKSKAKTYTVTSAPEQAISTISAKSTTPSVRYRSHIQDVGWEKDRSDDGATSGLEGKNKQIEAIKISLANLSGVKVKYQVHVESIGWMAWKSGGAVAGTEGKNKQVEAIKIKLQTTNKYSIKYRVYVQDIGWTDWAYDGEMAGTEGENKQIEAIEIKLADKKPSIRYRAHVQDIGWEKNRSDDGEVAGTEGKNKQIEALKISITDVPGIKVKYQVHVQDIGWMAWKSGGSVAGTTGKNKQVEAIKIKLETSKTYSVKYRVHVQDIGWMPWTYDGNMAGTEGKNKQVEAIQIKIVDKVTGDTSPNSINAIDNSKYPGFKSRLQAVQAAHPNWNIKVQYVGLDWNTVINEEFKVVSGSPRSLTQAPYLNEWKYSGDDNKYDVSQTWYRASKKAIAYMMDPRNSFDDYIFQFQNLEYTAETKDDIKGMVSGSFLNTTECINAIYKAATTYKISASHIVSRILQEQGKDGSGIMNGYKYNGKTVYNLFNINVSGNGSSGIKKGAEYADGKKWYSRAASIIGGTEFLSSNYIEKGQNTLYYQKFNVVRKPYYNYQYMQNIRAANDEGNKICKFYKELGLYDSRISFVIPIYENMPSTISARPNQ